MKKMVTIRYYALLGPHRGTQADTYETAAETVRQLLHEIQANKQIPLTTHIAKAIINNEFVDWDAPIHDGDHVTLLPPFSGG
ncbi:MAG: MoaD/ThiS family protein [Kiritimatiellae bacterium]|jgi:molybdopterin converting factor small subunit|nr:MoaD/ThiS family protein [Kiritimatiellia bacterium]MDD4341035.1 MoaD/ThiS family protein [Kiritimatiellia bacterium]MDY0149596.1 MoaD/ThiS family protein [Kiritimatiellia bacterium]